MKRIFYYALGGGFGHLTRSLAVVNTLPLGGPVRMLVSLTAAEISSVETPKQVELLGPPAGLDVSSRSAVAAWVASAAEEFAADEWFIDCFPAGLLGELAAIPQTCARSLVTRRVKWDEYRRRTPAIDRWPTCSRVFVTEALEARQAEDLRVIGPASTALKLRDFCAARPRRRLERLVTFPGGASLDGSWLVVHSGPLGEVEQILARALADGGADRKVLLVTPQGSRPRRLPAQVTHRAVYPIWPLFGCFARIYSAAGANSMRQLEPYRESHVAVPLRRRLDDQSRRKASSQPAISHRRHPAHW